ncbi:FAD-dependent monooxygenase [Lentzea sp. NBRC 102530]|uniref:FAD-dependent monooxygenase n=1 Tax=Lentzea sp. NBRC 102530 TaxID=3032201 RepID=UPI0024A332B5|nr:FAD-dependent monooxygenase [Lentzea sp. NBRC 102530]GLY46780.1 FAD-dependent oxidoreductase [Lentzea sp. NBRC 102530]
MINKRVLVSGASVGGPALAYWLHRYGFDVTVVEKAHGIRRGGQAVDFKGPIHRRVLSEMGVLDEVRAAHVVDTDSRIVNAKGRTVGVIPAAFSGGEINIPRGDLARILYGLTSQTCEYVFGDSITSLTQTHTGVDVTFARGEPRAFDLVIGADGMHSNVRKLAFGPEADHVTHLGYHYVLADLGTGDESVVYNEPGRTVGLGGSKAPAFFVFASDQLHDRDDVDTQKETLVNAYRDGRWRIPELLAKIPDATDFFMDSISRVTLERYSTGRVALVGDSAWGNALGGFGTGLAVVGAYVLAGELAVADGDHTVAFPRFEAKFREYASVSQKINAGRLLAPRSGPGIVGRNLLFTALKVFGPAVKILEGPAKKIELEGYPALRTV